MKDRLDRSGWLHVLVERIDESIQNQNNIKIKEALTLFIRAYYKAKEDASFTEPEILNQFARADSVKKGQMTLVTEILEFELQNAQSEHSFLSHVLHQEQLRGEGGGDLNFDLFD